MQCDLCSRWIGPGERVFRRVPHLEELSLCEGCAGFGLRMESLERDAARAYGRCEGQERVDELEARGEELLRRWHRWLAGYSESWSVSA